MNSNTEVIVLAAGKGTRMNTDIPKVLVPLNSKPMIQHVLQTIEDAGFSHPITVVGYRSEEVRSVCGDTCTYVLQAQQQGTGRAVHLAHSALKPETKNCIIAYGDQPFVTADTLLKLTEPLNNGVKLVIATSVINDKKLFQSQFKGYGRIVRDERNAMISIVEAKDATEEELAINEVNVGFMAFNVQWGFTHLSHLKNDNAQGEYYLTDLVKMAFKEGYDVASVQISEKEALGANTQEQLAVLHDYLDK